MPKTDTHLIDPNKVLDRIKHYHKIRYDKELAEFLGTTQATISNQRALRAGLDFERIILACREMNLTWVFFGDETAHPPFSQLEPIATGVLATHSDEIVTKLREAIRIIESQRKGGSSQ